MTSQTPGDMIVVEHISKWFGDFQALDDVSTTVKEREVVVAFGPSGSGKSTFIRTLNRLEEHDEGRILIDGIELTDVQPGGVAARHGAQSGDIIKSINDHSVASSSEAINFVKNNKDNYSTWVVVIENKGKQRVVTFDSPPQQ